MIFLSTVFSRLELLGDSILDCLVTGILQGDERLLNPDEITTNRALLVNNSTLASLARRNGFLNHIKMRLIDQDGNYNEPEETSKILSDVFEAVIGAIYIDSGNKLEIVWKVYKALMQDFFSKFLIIYFS